MNLFARLFVCSTLGVASIASLSGAALAAEDELVGTWKVHSLVREEFAIGRTTETPLVHMKGNIVFTAEGRYVVAIVAQQCAPSAADANQAKLDQSNIVQAGRYRVMGDKLIQYVEVASNEALIGSTRKQFIGWAGDQLVLEGSLTRTGVEGNAEILTLALERQR